MALTDVGTGFLVRYIVMRSKGKNSSDIAIQRVLCEKTNDSWERLAIHDVRYKIAHPIQLKDSVYHDNFLYATLGEAKRKALEDIRWDLDTIARMDRSYKISVPELLKRFSKVQVKGYEDAEEAKQ